MTEAITEVLSAYVGSDGDRTRALYEKLSALGPSGEIATNLLRACKTSERAKGYRRRSSRGASYDTKAWAMGNLCLLLGQHAEALGIAWGWGPDAETPGFPWVLYVDLGDGQQISFHAGERGPGPDYPGAWDGVKGVSGLRACAWAARLLEGQGAPPEGAAVCLPASSGERAGEAAGSHESPPAGDFPPPIRGATLFSGIGAPEAAKPGWDWLFCAEIEAFPSAVLAHHHPRSVNLGDVNADDFVERALAAGRPDVLVFGSPCQDFSVAGKRVGLDGARGNLALVALRVARDLGARWLVFENVPGLLSSYSGSAEAERQVREGGGRADAEEDSDFAAFLSAVRECGYLGCYRVLDAQFAGVPQRRRRVFAVFHLGDWRPAAAVLLEPEGLRGDPPPGREAGERVAPTVEARADAGGAGWGTDFLSGGGMAVDEPARAVKAGEMGHRHDPSTDNYVVGALGQRSADHPGGLNNESDFLVAFGGNNTSGAIDAATAVRAKGGTGHGDFESETFVLAFDETQITHPENRSRPDDRSPQLAGTARPPTVAFNQRTRGDDGRGYERETHFNEELSPTIEAIKPPGVVTFDCKAGGNTSFSVQHDGTIQGLRGDGHGGGHAAVAVPIHSDATRAASSALTPSPDAEGRVRLRDPGIGIGKEDDPMFSLTSTQPHAVAFKPSHYTRDKDSGPSEVMAPLTADADKGDQDPVLMDGAAVRRLTPRECERLQAFPDDYTLIKFRGKPAADGPRYRALGNSMCVYEVRWILSRIEMFEALRCR